MTDQEQQGVPRLEGADLLGDVMGEALEPQEQHEERRPPQPERQPQSASSDYYANLIAERRRKLKELGDKLANQATNRAYVKKDANGNEYIDFPQMTADQATMNLLKQEIDDYREEAEKRRQTSDKRFEQAKARALAYARAETVKVPEALRKQVAERFIDLFNGVSDSRIWERARYANVANMDADIQQLWESAVGGVTRQTWGGNGSNPAPTGLDGQPPKPETEREPEDPFVNNLMYAYERRKARSLTFAEAKALKAGQPQPKEGGRQ